MAIAQFFNLIAELVTSIETPSKEAKAEIEIHPVIAEAKIKKCSLLFRVVQIYLHFLLINSFWSISLMKKFVVSSIFFILNS